MPLASPLPLAAACLVLLPGCGARSDLESAAPASACGAPPPSGAPAQCSGWQPAGPMTKVSEPEPAGAMTYFFESMVPSAGGALISWLSVDGAPTATWRTRALDFDGTPRSPIGTHLSFPSADGVEWSMLLAGQECAFVGLTSEPTDGCRIVPLDENGASAGPAVQVESGGAADVGCSKLGRAPDGYSFVTISTDFSEAGLVTVSPAGSVLATTSLPSPAFAYGNRIVLRDGSFLNSTFEAPDMVANETRVQHFSPGGAPIADEAVIADPAAWPAQMAETIAGALAAWPGFDGSILVRPLDEDGHPMGVATTVATTGTLANLTLAGTPNGDVILAWSDHEGASTLLDLHVIALAPNGAPLGAPTLLGSFVTLPGLDVLADTDGRRALLVVAGTETDTTNGVLAVPLACAP